MDKNTILGILLMGAIVLGLMFLNKPSQEELARQREAAAREAVAENATSGGEAAAVLGVDTLTQAEKASAVATVRQLGVTDSLSGARTLNVGGARLSVGADGSLAGTVEAMPGEAPVDVALLSHTGSLPTATAAAALANLKAALADASRYREFARFTSGDSTTVRLSNKLLTLDLSNKGGVIARATLNNFKKADSADVRVMDYATNAYSFTLTTANQRLDTSRFYFRPVMEGDTAVAMVLDLGNGARFGFRYKLLPDSYLVTMDVLQEGMAQVMPANATTMEFNWQQQMARNEAGRMFEERNSALYWMYLDGDVKNLSEGKDAAKEVTERFRWVGYKNQFFSAILMARTNFLGATFDSEVLKDDPAYLKRMTTRASLDYSPAKTNPASFTWFLGPNSYPLMHSIQDGDIYPDANMNLTKVIPLGWSLFRWINTLIVIPVFSFLGSFISNYGIIILLLTVFIKLILFPFTYKSLKAQARMRLLAPEIKQINEKWPGQENAMKRQQETMALYSKSGASPFSGCLPMLLQMPILIAMFSFFPSAIELRDKAFLWAKDLSAPDAIVSWTTNIPFISSTFGNHISLFCLLMTATNIIYTRITMQTQPQAAGTPNMKWMMYLMPVMFLFIFNNYAAGLSYYYFLSLLITILMTWAFRRVVSEEKLRAEMAERAKKPRKKSKFMARLEEAQRQQQAMLRQQQAAGGGGKRRR